MRGFLVLTGITLTLVGLTGFALNGGIYNAWTLVTLAGLFLAVGASHENTVKS